MRTNKTIYPKCLFKEKAKATYISHDGYVRPCCYVHRHNKTEKAEPWMVELRHNLRSGDSLEKIFDTPEYRDFFKRLKTGKNIPWRCYDVCGKKETDIGADHRKEKYIDGKPIWQEVAKNYDKKYKVQPKLQVDLTHRCSLGCPKCNRFVVDFKDHLSGQLYPLGHQVLNKVELSVDDFKKIFKDNPQIATGDVDFCGTWGDAIYHPDFIEICKVIKSHGAAINIATNGSRKKAEWWDELYEVLDPKRDSIVFAMDGIKETADMYRKFLIYEDVITAMEKGAKVGMTGSKWSFIVFNFNQHQIEEARQIAKDIGIRFEVVKSHRWDGPNDPLMPSKEWLPESIIKEYKL